MDQTPAHSQLDDDEQRSTIEAPDDRSGREERVAEMLEHTIDVPVLAEVVEQQEAADAADTLETLEEHDAVELLERLPDQSAADALAEMETPLAVSVLTDLAGDDPDYAG